MASTRIFGNCCRALMAAAKTSAATATGTVTKARGRPTGILKPQLVSPALGEFLGTKEVSRSDAVKKVWEYIKNNNLQVGFICSLVNVMSFDAVFIFVFYVFAIECGFSFIMFIC